MSTFAPLPVPGLLQKPIQPQDVELFVRKLTSRHCKRLANEMPNIDEKRIFDISDENNTMLFDTQSLICDWIANEECCNYDKRCKLDDILMNIGRHDMTGKDLLRYVFVWFERSVVKGEYFVFEIQNMFF